MTREDTHPATWPVDQLLAHCEMRRQRRSGPGGQHRNKVETGIFLRHHDSQIEVSATEERSQERNRHRAIHRLRMELAIQLRRDVPTGHNPSPLWQSRCRGGRIAVSTAHEDFPSVLAEALDRLKSHGWQIKTAADPLGCTSSQLIRLLKREPRALTLVNQRRQEIGLSKLK